MYCFSGLKGGCSGEKKNVFLSKGLQRLEGAKASSLVYLKCHRTLHSFLVPCQPHAGAPPLSPLFLGAWPRLSSTPHHPTPPAPPPPHALFYTSHQLP